MVLSAGQWAQKTTAMKKTSKKNLARAQSGLSLVSLVGRALGPQLCGAGRARARARARALSTPAYKGNSKFSRVTFKTIKTKNLYLIASCNCAKAGPNPCRYCKVMITQSLGRKMQKSRGGNFHIGFPLFVQFSRFRASPVFPPSLLFSQTVSLFSCIFMKIGCVTLPSLRSGYLWKLSYEKTILEMIKIR